MLPTLRSSFPGLVDEFFGDAIMNSMFSVPAYKPTVPAVNILEGKDDFKIEVAAPGLRRDDFKIDLHNNILTISSETKNESEENQDKYMRREFSYTCFKRTFALPNSVDAEKINASHKDGILTVMIPKREEAKEKAPRQISIS